MPKKVFYQLSDEKRNKLINASYLVFSKNSYFNTSINQLTKDLDITRTAFYYYFYNKEDLYDYLVELEKNKFINNFIYNKDEKLSLEEIFFYLFDFLSEYKNTSKQDFIIDLLYNISFDRKDELLEKLTNHGNYCHFTGFDEYNIDSIDEAREIVYIFFSIVAREISIYYKTNKSLEDAKRDLEKKIDLIKYGIDKGEQNEPQYRYSN